MNWGGGFNPQPPTIPTLILTLSTLSASMLFVTNDLSLITTVNISQSVQYSISSSDIADKLTFTLNLLALPLDYLMIDLVCVRQVPVSLQYFTARHRKRHISHDFCFFINFHHYLLLLLLLFTMITVSF